MKIKGRYLGRENHEIRPLEIEVGYLNNCRSSCLIKLGNTHVITSATISKLVPSFVKGTKSGWLTAEYSMLPRSSEQRIVREVTKGKSAGRTTEIQRFIGRSLRAALDLKLLGERQIIIDCDVINADGGTRTAAITGAFISLTILMKYCLKQEIIKENPILFNIAAISCGVLDQEVRADLDYAEDIVCDVDGNFVMTSEGDIVEIQISAEGKPYTLEELEIMLKLARKNIKEMIIKQNEVLQGY